MIISPSMSFFVRLVPVCLTALANIWIKFVSAFLKLVLLVLLVAELLTPYVIIGKVSDVYIFFIEILQSGLCISINGSIARATLCVGFVLYLSVPLRFNLLVR